MKIKLRNGLVKEYEEKVSVIDVINDINPSLGKEACAALINETLVDLRYVIEEDCNLAILTFEDEYGKSAYRHTAAHILAQAVKRLYPNTKLAIGPSIKDGFYYDFDFDEPFTSEDLSSIEDEMKKIIKESLSITRFTLSRNESLELMKSMKEDYKVELIEDLPEDSIISFYKQGDYVDLCAGPHLMNTNCIKAFKLTSVAGAYWRGNEKNKISSL